MQQALQRLNVSKEHVDQYGVINAVEYALVKAGAVPEEQGGMTVEHAFVQGHYIRTLHIPKGSIVVSKHHKHFHPFTVTKGCLAVIQEVDGEPDHCLPKVIHVGGEGEHFVAMTEPKTRRMVFAFEDSTWTTVHATSLTSVKEIEAAIILPNPNPLLRC